MRRNLPAFRLVAFAVAVLGPGAGFAPAEGRPAGPGAEYPRRARFGMNLAQVADWSREWALVDLFKASRPWIYSDKTTAFDRQGNPLLQYGQSVETLMCRGLEGHYPAGVYTVTHRGRGRVELKRFDVAEVLRDEPGRLLVRVAPGDLGLSLVVTFSDPRDPVHNIRVWMPGFEGARSPFHPLFVKRLGPFGALRFMDWQATNNSPLKSWGQRARPGDLRWVTEAGMPPEVMVDLANRCGADPWFCMPHQADDDFVRQFARLVKGRLDPARKVYVEYSNEVWNWGFAQTRWAHEQGKARGLGNPENLRFYSQRAVEVFRIWEEEFGGRGRLVRVMGSQFVSPWVSEQVLTWRDAARHCDALAVAPYFGHRFGDPKNAAETARLGVGPLLDALEEEVRGPEREALRKQAEVARKFGLELVAYEGGQHLAGFHGAENNKALADLFIAANRHPRMYDLYRAHLANWAGAGGGLYAVYNNVTAPSKWGSWGTLEYQDQPLEKAPKRRAIEDVIREKLPGK